LGCVHQISESVEGSPPKALGKTQIAGAAGPPAATPAAPAAPAKNAAAAASPAAAKPEANAESAKAEPAKVEAAKTAAATPAAKEPAAASARAPAPPAAAPPPSSTGKPLRAVEAALGAHSATNFYKGLAGGDIVSSGGLFVATYQAPEV